MNSTAKFVANLKTSMTMSCWTTSRRSGACPCGQSQLRHPYIAGYSKDGRPYLSTGICRNRRCTLVSVWHPDMEDFAGRVDLEPRMALAVSQVRRSSTGGCRCCKAGRVQPTANGGDRSSEPVHWTITSCTPDSMQYQGGCYRQQSAAPTGAAASDAPFGAIRLDIQSTRRSPWLHVLNFWPSSSPPRFLVPFRDSINAKKNRANKNERAAQVAMSAQHWREDGQMTTPLCDVRG
jgi:hypothetical protein